MNPMPIYVLVGRQTDSYGEHHEWTVAAFPTKEDAKAVEQQLDAALEALALDKDGGGKEFDPSASTHLSYKRMNTRSYFVQTFGLVMSCTDWKAERSAIEDTLKERGERLW